MKHQLVDARGTRIHCVEARTGPLVLFVHGFPESWYSWRHQLRAVADAGFRAVAIDVRGYGRSAAPLEIEAYGMLQHVSDNIGVVEALTGQDSTAIIVGHDWGSSIAAHSALLRPDVFTAVAMLSVPYTPPGGRRPTEAFAEMGRQNGPDEESYINYFQEPGRAEREIELDVRSWLRGIYLASAGSARASSFPRGAMPTVKRGGMLCDRFPTTDVLPVWFTADDLDFLVEEFERTGFRGALNRYRNVDRDWQNLQPWKGQPIRVPSLYIGGEYDAPTRWGSTAIARFPTTLPNLRGSHILPGCGHWIPQQRPEEVNRLLVEWLRSL